MPTRNVNLTKRFDDYIEQNVASGRFSNASEVVREGLRLLEQQDKEEAAWLKYLEEAAKPALEDIERGDYIELHSEADVRALFAKARESGRQQLNAKRPAAARRKSA